MTYYVTHGPDSAREAELYAEMELDGEDVELVERADVPPDHIYVTSMRFADDVVFPGQAALPYGYEIWQRN